jgi:hypothetical protein
MVATSSDASLLSLRPEERMMLEKFGCPTKNTWQRQSVSSPGFGELRKWRESRRDLGLAQDQQEEIAGTQKTHD